MANPVVVSLTGWNELVVTALLAAEEAMMGGLFLAATYVTDLTACLGSLFHFWPTVENGSNLMKCIFNCSYYKFISSPARAAAGWAAGW